MSYSTPTSLRTRIGPRLLIQIFTPVGIEEADYDTALQDALDAAMKTIDIRIGHRTNVDAVALLAGVEEEIANWYLWGTVRGFGEGETQAAGAKPGYDNAIRMLDDGEFLSRLPSEPPPIDPTTGQSTASWESLTPVWTPANFRGF